MVADGLARAYPYPPQTSYAPVLAALQAQAGTGTIRVRPHLDRGFDPPTVIIFLGLLGAGLLSNLIQAFASVVRFLSRPPT